MTNCFCAGASLRTRPPLGTFLLNISDEQGELEQRGAAPDPLMLQQCGSGWMKWEGLVLSLTDCRWTVCTCSGWEAATRPGLGSTVRKFTSTLHRHLVRFIQLLHYIMTFFYISLTTQNLHLALIKKKICQLLQYFEFFHYCHCSVDWLIFIIFFLSISWFPPCPFFNFSFCTNSSFSVLPPSVIPVRLFLLVFLSTDLSLCTFKLFYDCLYFSLFLQLLFIVIP